MSTSPDHSKQSPLSAAERLSELSTLAEKLAHDLKERHADQRIAEKFVEVSKEALRGSSVLELIREAEREREENRILMRISMKLSSAGEMHEVLKAILDSLRQVVQFSSAGIFVYNAEQGQLEVDLLFGYEDVESPRLYQKFREGIKAGKGIVANVLFSGEHIYVPDVREDSRYVSVRDSTRSELAVPIQVRDEVIGVFNLESDDLDGFSEHDRRILSAVAGHAGVALERARADRLRMKNRRIQEEFELARSIQQTFLPKNMPVFPPYDVGGMNFPSSEIGGDYFDFIPMTEKDMGIIIGDVAGHGVPAALLMANFRACLRVEARSRYAIPSILCNVNEFLVESNRPDDFVTAFYGVLDRQNHVLTYSNAGHNPPLLIREDASIRQLNEGGMLLGAFSNQQYEQVRLHLRPGDLIVFYTDGVTESLDADENEFGIDRLVEAAVKYRDLPALEMVRRICHDVQLYQSQDSIKDDLTLSVVKYDPSLTN